MRQIIYDVALTLDGFLCGEDGSTRDFLETGEHASDYGERLQTYDTVLMGRKTYEVGLAHGVPPGARAYPHMEHFIFSSTLDYQDAAVTVVKDDWRGTVQRLKESTGGDIYLCGGGELAGFLLDHGLIDRLIVKLNPIVLGRGRSAFGDRQRHLSLSQTSTKVYSNGVTLLCYDVGPSSSNS